MLTDDDLQRELTAAFHEQADPIARTAVAPAALFRQGLGRRRRRTAVRAGVAMAAATMAVIAAVVGITAQGRPMRPAASEDAVQLLAKIARAAARQPAPRVQNSQYMYTETVDASPPGSSEWTYPPPSKGGPMPRDVHLARSTVQAWVPVADVCRIGLERDIPAGGRVSSAVFAARGPGVTCPSTGDLNDPTYRLLQTLPTSPQALLALIYRVESGHGPSPAQEAFVTIGDLLRDTIAPPTVTAALYRAAALIPGVTVIPDATDAIGRHGVAVARTGPGADGGVREELIFSRATLQLIGERTVFARTGMTTSATAIIVRAFVGHRGQLP